MPIPRFSGLLTGPNAGCANIVSMALENRGRDGARIFSGPPDIGPVIDAARRRFGPRYGGAWYENQAIGRKFVVAVAGADSSDGGSLRDDLGQDTSWLDVVAVKYSETDLLEFLGRLNSLLDQVRPTASLLIGPDPPNNCIKLEINPEDADRLAPLLRAAVPDDALVVEVHKFVVGPD